MKNIIENIKKLDTTCISDACDRLEISGSLSSLKPILPGSKLCGRAFTVKYRPSSGNNSNVGDFLDDLKEGDLAVIDNGGRTDATVWGDIMSLYSKINGIAGAIINGACRDIPEIKKLGFPIFSAGTNAVTGKGRYEIEYIQKAIYINNTKIVPGDIIIADDSGIICIPENKAEEVYEIAKSINDIEEKIKQAIQSGTPLNVARNMYNYHNLQKPNTNLDSKKGD